MDSGRMICRGASSRLLQFINFSWAFLLLLAPLPASAHPHQWVDVASEVLFDDKGQIEAVRHHWRFDEAFTVYALQGLDADGDGLYRPEELRPLAQENVESLADFDFFTFISAGDYRAGFAAPKEYELEFDGSRLTLHFTLPLAQPLSSRGELLLQVYDPEYYIAFGLPSSEAVRLVGAPAACRLHVVPAATPDAAAAAALATIGPDQRELPAEMQGLAAGIDNSATINCGGPAQTAGAETNADQALSRLSANGGDLRALPAAGPAAGEPPSAPALASADASEPEEAASSAPVRTDGWFAWIGAMQATFNQRLTQSLSALKADGSAFWWLGGFSFLYGIIHAAGPGHGKVVISSYLLANEQRVRRGVAISFLSALVQAFVAIGVVGLMAAVLNMTSMAITETAGFLETGSFALVALLGAYLLARKVPAAWSLLGRRRAAPANGQQGHDHHHAHHHHGPSCGCAHHAPPAATEKTGVAGAAAAVLSVGLRPCSGALVVLVFALAQGIFWAGVASTFLMALGTALTVAVLAALAVGAKDVAARIAAGNGQRSAEIMLGVEVVAALFITALGAALFAGSLAV